MLQNRLELAPDQRTPVIRMLQKCLLLVTEVAYLVEKQFKLMPFISRKNQASNNENTVIPSII